MALQLDVLYKGIIADYWKIVSMVPNYVHNYTQVQVNLYVNKDIRDDGDHNSLEQYNFSLEGVDLTRSDVYAALKSDPTFEGAIDV